MKRLSLVVVVVALGCGKKAAPVDLGTALHPFGEVANVWFGMKPAEVEAAAPQLKAEKGSSWYGALHDGVDYTVRLDGGRVVQISIQLSLRSPNDLWKAWGAGTVYAPPPDEHRRYFDAALGARADVSVVGDGFAIDLVPMTSLATLIGGSDPTMFGGVKVIGQPMAKVISAFTVRGFAARQMPNDNSPMEMGEVKLPATEWTASGGGLTLFTESGDIVNSWALSVPIDAIGGPQLNPTAKAAILAVYEHLWGTPTDDGGGNLTYPTTPPVQVVSVYVMPSVRVSPPPPSAPPASKP